MIQESTSSGLVQLFLPIGVQQTSADALRLKTPGSGDCPDV